MTDTSLKRQLKVLTIPVFIEMALVMMLGAVDTVMLSRYSDNSVAAVGLDNQLISLVFLVYQFFSMGAAILCAQYIGAGLRKRLVQVVGIALTVNLVLDIFAGSTLRATGDVVYPFVVGVIFQWSVAVGVSYVIGIPLGYGLIGMWVGFALDENIRGVILVRRWRSGKWRKKGFVKD